MRNEDLEAPSPVGSLRVARSYTNRSLSNNFSTDNRDSTAQRDKTQLGQGIVEITVSPAGHGRPIPFSVSAILSKTSWIDT